MFSQPRSSSAQASTLLQRRYVIVDHTLAKLSFTTRRHFRGKELRGSPTPSNQPGIDLLTEQALKIYDEPSSTQEFDLCHAPYKRGKAKGGLTWTS
jgi:hypothetical protein